MTSLLCSPFSGVGDSENITFDVHFDDENAKISVLRTIDRANCRCWLAKDGLNRMHKYVCKEGTVAG